MISLQNQPNPKKNQCKAFLHILSISLRIWLALIFASGVVVTSFELHAALPNCSGQGGLSSETLKAISQVPHTNQMSDKQKEVLSNSIGALIHCFQENYNNSELDQKQRSNLLNIVKTTFVEGFEKRASEYIEYGDISEYISAYKKLHQTIYGIDAKLPPGIMLLEKNQALYLADRKARCETVEVDTSKMGPVRDQEDTNWCFAFAAADLMSFYTSEPVSAVDIGILNNNFSTNRVKMRLEYPKHIQSLLSAKQLDEINLAKSSEYDGGPLLRVMTGKSDPPSLEKYNTAIVNLFNSIRDDNTESNPNSWEPLKIANERGVCTESQLPSLSTTQVGGLNNQISFLRAHMGALSHPNGVCSKYEVPINENFKNLSAEQIRDVMIKTNPQFYLLELRNLNCNKFLKTNKKVFSSKLPQTKAMMDLLNDQLSKKEPAMVGYNFSMLFAGTPGGHVSTVVGRRWNEKANTCEYKFRNTAGKLNRYFHGNRSTIEDGYHWVKEEDLVQNLREVVSLK